MKNKIIKYPVKTRKKKKIVFLIVVLALTYNICIPYAFAKYSSQVVGSANIKIATPIMELQGEETKEITVLNPNISYNFSVKNYNEAEEINEVDMCYYIEIVSKNRKNMEFNLYKGEEKIELIDYKTEKMDLVKGKKQIDEYYLEAKFLGEQVQDIYSQVEIKVYSVQKSN